jgi:hypothetical protein
VNVLPAGTVSPAPTSTVALSWTIVPTATLAFVTSTCGGWCTCVVTDEFTQIFWAFALSPGNPSPVVRVSDTPPTLTVVVALITVVPTDADVNVTVQLPVASTVRHGDPAIVPGPLTFVTVMLVPAGAFTKPVPVFTFTCTVKVCVSLIGSVSVAGVIWMFASTAENGSQAPVALAASAVFPLTNSAM